MSQRTDRATRRELRRAMGESGVSVIEKVNVVILGHESALDEHRKALAALARTSGAHERRISALADGRVRDAAYLEAFLRMPWRQRLRWIVTGRWEGPDIGFARASGLGSGSARG